MQIAQCSESSAVQISNPYYNTLPNCNKNSPIVDHAKTHQVVPKESLCNVCFKQCTINQSIVQSCDCTMHSDCLNLWRSVNNYPITCPVCCKHFSFQLVKTETNQNWKCDYYCYVISFLLLTFFGICAGVAIWSVFTWGVDKNKNIPVAMEYAFSSVINGVPNKNTTTQWREEFKGERRTYQYYSLFGLGMFSITVLLFYAIDACSEKNQQVSNYSTITVSQTSDYYLINTYWYPFWYSSYPMYCYSQPHIVPNNIDPVDTTVVVIGASTNVSKNNNSNCNCGNCCDCGGGDSGLMCCVCLIVIILIVIAIIVSALFLIYFGCMARIGYKIHQYEKYLRMRTCETHGQLVICNKTV